MLPTAVAQAVRVSVHRSGSNNNGGGVGGSCCRHVVLFCPASATAAGIPAMHTALLAMEVVCMYMHVGVCLFVCLFVCVGLLPISQKYRRPGI